MGLKEWGIKGSTWWQVPKRRFEEIAPNFKGVLKEGLKGLKSFMALLKKVFKGSI